MNAEAERYLRRATRGLWGRRRREVREELAAHLEGRVTAHRIAGLSEQGAVKKALAELGSPGMVSVGMARLYTLPTVMGSSLMLTAMCLGIFALWPESLAQTLQGTFYWPSRECLTAVANDNLAGKRRVCIASTDEFWVSERHLRKTLEPQGVTFGEAFGPAAKFLRVSVPGTTAFYVPTASSEEEPDELFINDQSFTRVSGYLSLWDIVQNFTRNPNARFAISGWENPTLHVNNVSFQLKEEKRTLAGPEFYGSYLGAVFYKELAIDLWPDFDSIGILFPEDYKRLANRPETTFEDASLGVLGEAGEVYGMITLIDSRNPLGRWFFGGSRKGAGFWMQVVRTTDGQKLNVRFPQGTVRFNHTFSSTNLKPGDSVLVRLTGSQAEGEGWYEIVSPEDITLTGRN